MARRLLSELVCWSKQSVASSPLLRLQRHRFYTDAVDPWGIPPPRPENRVVVTGLGLCTPLGVGVEKVWERLLAGRTGIRGLTEDDLPDEHRTALLDLTSRVVGCVPEQELITAPWAPAPDANTRRLSKSVTYALCAAAEALGDADWQPSTEAACRATGVAIGAGMTGTAEMAEAGMLLQQGRIRRLSPFFVPRILINMAAGAVSMKFGLQGPNLAASTACATGVHNLGDAYLAIKNGYADVMVAGGTESCIDAVSVGGFCRLKALSSRFNSTPELASRPFDVLRDGFVMGEGAGIVVLEEMQHAIARGAHMYAEVRGYGMSGDAYHITQPAPDGAGAVLAMQRALELTGVPLSDVCYINAHATSTPLGDAVEQKAIAAVFGSLATDPNTPEGPLAVSSTKGATGHLLGAAGAVESVFSILSVAHGMAPPTVNLETPEPCELANLVRGEAQVLREVPRAVLNNSFGFGGTNASMLFCTPPVILEQIADGTP